MQKMPTTLQPDRFGMLWLRSEWPRSSFLGAPRPLSRGTTGVASLSRQRQSAFSQSRSCSLIVGPASSEAQLSPIPQPA
jgi:hypothetical protein